MYKEEYVSPTNQQTTNPTQFKVVLSVPKPPSLSHDTHSSSTPSPMPPAPTERSPKATSGGVYEPSSLLKASYCGMLIKQRAKDPPPPNVAHVVHIVCVVGIFCTIGCATGRAAFRDVGGALEVTFDRAGEGR